MSVNAWAHNQVKAMFKEVQKLGILNTFTPLEVVRDQRTCVRVLRCLGLGEPSRSCTYTTVSL